MNELAPIVLFVYNRPWHTRQTVEALQKNHLAAESDLYIYADGAKTPGDPKVEEVRNYIKSIAGFRSITVIERDRNWGLADNIVDGVTTIVNKYGKIIVLEDDIVTSIGFLKYMNEALQLYENEDRVMHISAHIFENNIKEIGTIFYNATSCWGWATWKRAWACLNTNAVFLYKTLINHPKFSEFDKGRGFLQQLQENKNGIIKTWAILWHTSVFISSGYSLHPTKTLVKNIGFDGSGSGNTVTKDHTHKTIQEFIEVSKIPIEESSTIYNELIMTLNNRRNHKSLRYKLAYLKSLLIDIVTFKITKINQRIDHYTVSKFVNKYEINLGDFGAWSMSIHDFIIIEKLIKNHPKKNITICELGSGISSVIILKILQKYKSQYKLISIEAMETWIETVREKIFIYNIMHNIQLHHVEYSNENWYEKKTLDNIIGDQIIDILIVDAPPDTLGFESRKPAYLFFKKNFTFDSCIALHDTNRTDEFNILKEWSQYFKTLKIFKTEKGIGILKNHIA